MLRVERPNGGSKKKLISAVEILSTNDYDCAECDDTLKKERGCKAKGTIPFYIGREATFRCPLALISPLSYEYVRAYAFYAKGWLPNGESWQKETKKFLDAMIVIENTKVKLENEQAQKKTKK